MSGHLSKLAAVPRVIGSQDDLLSGDIINVDFPHVRPFYDSTIGRKVFSKQRPALVLYTKPRQMVIAYISSKIPALRRISEFNEKCEVRINPCKARPLISIL